jgi:hypothetical protein
MQVSILTWESVSDYLGWICIFLPKKSMPPLIHHVSHSLKIIPLPKNRAIAQRRSRIIGLCSHVLLSWLFALARPQGRHQETKIRSYHGKEDDHVY